MNTNGIYDWLKLAYNEHNETFIIHNVCSDRQGLVKPLQLKTPTCDYIMSASIYSSGPTTKGTLLPGLVLFYIELA